jgi:hypothetical protein
MSTRGLAKTYLRYWTHDNDGTWRLSDNAPKSVHLCVRTMPKTITPNMAYEAFRIVAGGAALERPTALILDWLRDHPLAIGHLDTALAGKKPPRKFAELIEKAYSAELLTARNHVNSCLEREILI